MEEWEFEEEEETKLKKVYIFLVSFFILTIFLVYIFSTSVGAGILASLISSSTVENNELDFSFDGRLIFEEDSLEELKKVYFDNLKVEFKACLNGRKLNNVYFIDEVHIPVTYSQKFNQVIAEPCSEDSLVSLHSHPYKRCIPSEQDFRSFASFKERQKEGLMIVMCEPGRFGVYE
ncbi:MAG: hypothetical protein CMH63_03215 [Nanoarchaeota archaeon]|jgi:proteasome lid subunit RPN8/RPN11|nr:hypothetical protein [Nanoarchaeota archaeon]|tara:strand:- start:9471 stop:9998 length:528 start_codon:yes stop_codon:yes gene_type:complete